MMLAVVVIRYTNNPQLTTYNNYNTPSIAEALALLTAA
jgi:hypothetical protein